SYSYPSFLIARMILVFARVERTLLSVAFDFDLAFEFDFLAPKHLLRPDPPCPETQTAQTGRPAPLFS
ncbi:MAG: hypothetical protein WBV63_13225, partial [Candidatus Sulfotelmatobacter sp.]